MSTGLEWLEDEPINVLPVPARHTIKVRPVCNECGSDWATGLHEGSCPYVLARLVQELEDPSEPLPFDD